jgi:mono/diheme cytochrome c family protein
MNLGPDIYSNPAGADRLGRCVTCHMPKTAMSGGRVIDDEGFVVRGDISSHTFDNVSPETSEAMAGAGLEPVPNSCVECHRGTLRGAWPDYRFQEQ